MSIKILCDDQIVLQILFKGLISFRILIEIYRFFKDFY